MSSDLQQLAPKALWSIFNDICSIPHPSKHEEQLIDYVKKLAAKNQTTITQDTVGNLILNKAASPGYEKHPIITLQAHLDMVPQANSNIEHNFATMPITPFIDKGWVTADSTTLGADNGIGLAAILAIFSSNDLKHGPLEALLTIDEETGMTGAFGLGENSLSGDILINLDSEEEGELFIGCAGGINTEIEFTMNRIVASTDVKHLKLSLTGLKGGHSGCDINLPRGNAIIELARLLLQFKDVEAHLHSISGGSLRNAIPREAYAVISCPSSKEEVLKKVVESFENTLRHELGDNGSLLNVSVSKTKTTTAPYCPTDARRLLQSIVSCPNGVLVMNSDFPGVVEASSNIGVLHSKEDTISIKTLQRASMETLKEKTALQVRSCFELAGATVRNTGAYPGWTPNRNSKILTLMQKLYFDMFGKNAKIQIIHAGLECGLLYAKNPTMDVISFGPTIKFPHSPDEKVNIQSVQNFWQLLVSVIENSKQW